MAALPPTAFVAGCMALRPAPVVPAPDKGSADPASGYVAGAFTHGRGVGFALMISDAVTGEERALQLGDPGPMTGNVLEEQVAAIRLPPGRYIVANWKTFDAARTQVSRSAVRNASMDEAVTVSAGKVTYLGNFTIDATHDTRSSGGGRQPRISIKANPVAAAQERARFNAAWPALASLAFDCRACVDTPRARLADASLQPPMRPAAHGPGTAEDKPANAVALTDDWFTLRRWQFPALKAEPKSGGFTEWLMFPGGVMDLSNRDASARATYRVSDDRLCLDRIPNRPCYYVIDDFGQPRLLEVGTGNTTPLTVR
jgi:hypothetical protein